MGLSPNGNCGTGRTETDASAEERSLTARKLWGKCTKRRLLWPKGDDDFDQQRSNWPAPTCGDPIPSAASCEAGSLSASLRPTRLPRCPPAPARVSVAAAASE